MARVRQERSAGVIIFRPPGEFLLLDYGKHWDFPKGHIKKGETELAAATRELAEETGLLDVRFLPDFRHEITYFFRKPRRGLVRKSVVFFLAEAAKGDVTLSHEHVGFEWLNFDRAIERVTFPTAKEVLRRANDRLAAAERRP